MVVVAGIALFLSISGASPAIATSAQFEAGAYPVTLKGTEEILSNGGSQKFVTTAGTTTCDTVSATATLSGASSSVTTTSITYTDSALAADTCTGPLGTEPKIEMNGCQFRFNAGETVGTAEEKTSKGTVDLICTGTNTIVINKANLCTIKIGSQNGLSSVIYDTHEIVGGGSEDVTISPNITNIKYSHSGLCGTGSGTSGSYTGNVTVHATFADGSTRSVTVK
jgi:hypothetical protein